MIVEYTYSLEEFNDSMVSVTSVYEQDLGDCGWVTSEIFGSAVVGDLLQLIFTQVFHDTNGETTIAGLYSLYVDYDDLEYLGLVYGDYDSCVEIADFQIDRENEIVRLFLDYKKEI